MSDHLLDILDMFHEHDARKEEMLERMPRCDDCGEHIQEEELFEVDGELFCFDCMKKNYGRYTKDFIKE